MKTCFIVCPIGKDGTETRKRSDQVLRHIISPVCQANGYEVVRVDHINDSDSINQTIIKKLRESDLVVTDLTDHNPNAYFETGYRLALGKPMIQIMQDGQQLPFDVASTRTIFYDLNDLDKLEATKDKLNETIRAVSIDSEETEVVQAGEPPHLNQQVFSLLFSIKDSIEQLTSSIDNKNRADMESVVSVFSNQLQKNNVPIESKMMEQVITTMFNEPEKMLAFASVMEQIKLTQK